MPEEVQQSSIKLPQFWPTDPDLWFAQAEAEFVLRNITSDQTKYSLLVQALDQETARRVRDVFKTPVAEVSIEDIVAFEAAEIDIDAPVPIDVTQGDARTQFQQTVPGDSGFSQMVGETEAGRRR